MCDSQVRGLYDPRFEHDSCGFGLIAQIDSKPSRWLVETAVSALARLNHRGAVAADGLTGDGCGLLIHRPEAYLRAVADKAKYRLVRRRRAGVGLAAGGAAGSSEDARGDHGAGRP